jgi:hypothetical protein
VLDFLLRAQQPPCGNVGGLYQVKVALLVGVPL